MEVMKTDKQSCVLVTGGRGFIGKSVGKLLQRHGYQVISLDVIPANMRSSELVCDVTDLAALERLFRGERIDGIVHLAAVLPTAAQREPLLATKVNIQGSVNLTEMARQFEVRRFIFGSSLSVYGTCPAEQVVTEMDRAAPEDLYGAAKLYVEQLGEAYRHTHGLEFVSLRIGRVVGPGAQSSTSAWRSEIFECLEKASPAEIEIPYADSERILVVHVEDVAKMFLQLLKAPRLAHGLYNAPCESVIVGELKSEIERLNPRLRVKLEGRAVVGNPRRVDWSRFAREFGFATAPIIERLGPAADGHR
jgi:nucleoside-diphosphate-sugar epimerase